MNKGDIVIRLKAHETALKARGVAHAALFGSVAATSDGTTATSTS